MDGALFTLELIADSLRGPVSLLSSLAAARGTERRPAGESNIRPALGLRLLDLPHVLLEPLDGEVCYGTADTAGGKCQIIFGGKGKALTFELLDDSEEILPLWLMALVRCHQQVGREEGTPPGAPAAAVAVLIASACVDLRAEVQRAREVHRHGSIGSAFRRCTFRMTAVQNLGGALCLDCYFRVYAGEHRPLAGGELLLEPSVLAPPQVMAAGEEKAENEAEETQTKKPEQATVASKTEESGDGAGEDAQAKPLSACSEFQHNWQRVSRQSMMGDVFFPGEILLPSSSSTAAAAQA